MNSTPQNGNVLIALIVGKGSTGKGYPNVSSVTQTNVAWGSTQQIGLEETVSQPWDIEIWAGIVGSGASTSVVISFNGTGNGFLYAVVCEYSGLVTSGILDKTATDYNASYVKTEDTGQTAQTNQASELWIGGIAVSGLSSAQTNTSSFTMLDGGAGTSGSGSVGYFEYIAANIGQAEATSSNTQYCQWLGCIATFKAKTAFVQTVADKIGYADTRTAKPKVNETDGLGFSDSALKKARKISSDNLCYAGSALKRVKTLRADLVSFLDSSMKTSRKVNNDNLGYVDSCLKKASTLRADLLRFADSVTEKVKANKSDVLGFLDLGLKKARKLCVDNFGFVDSAIKKIVVVSVDKLGFSEVLIKRVRSVWSDILGFFDAGFRKPPVRVKNVTFQGQKGAVTLQGAMGDVVLQSGEDQVNLKSDSD